MDWRDQKFVDKTADCSPFQNFVASPFAPVPEEYSHCWHSKELLSSSRPFESVAMWAVNEDSAMRFLAYVVTYCLVPVEHFELVVVVVWLVTSQVLDSSVGEVTSAASGSFEAKVEEMVPGTGDC